MRTCSVGEWVSLYVCSQIYHISATLYPDSKLFKYLEMLRYRIDDVIEIFEHAWIIFTGNNVISLTTKTSFTQFIWSYYSNVFLTIIALWWVIHHSLFRHTFSVFLSRWVRICVCVMVCFSICEPEYVSVSGNFVRLCVCTVYVYVCSHDPNIFTG